MATAELTNEALKGGVLILSKGLSLHRGDNLALFSDEETEEAAEIVRRAAAELQIEVNHRFVPLKEQAAYEASQDLPAYDQAALREARGILTCLSASPQGTAYRYALLDAGPDDWKYFGHMPGANLEVLALASKVDFDAAVRKCDDLAVALYFGKKAVLETYERPGHSNDPRPHRLTMDLTGPSPITSTGVIPRGTWGNVPGGETFISPKEWTGTGSFVLNGAFLDWVIPRGESLILHFSDGKLDGVEGSGESHVRFLELLDRCRKEAGNCHCALAEFGISVNSGLSELTGNSLLDEKCLGTAHIALGDGKRYGGAVDCDIHEDLITWHPSVWIDDAPILKNGELIVESARWRDSIFQPPAVKPSAGMRVSRSNQARGESHNGSGLLLHKKVALGRACSYTVGDAESSVLLARIYEMIPSASVSVGRLAAQAGAAAISAETLFRGIEILLRHHLIYET